MQNIKARTRALVPLQKPVLTTKSKRTGPETGPMRLGKLSFLEAAGFFKARLVPFPAAFGGGDEAGLADMGCTIVRPPNEGPQT